MRKYIKLLAFLCLPLAFTACDDDENLNGGEATVQFQETNITISERATTLNVPITVSGDHTGLIKLRVECAEANGLKDDENILITSRELRIPAGVEEVNVEIYFSNLLTEEETTGRYFTLEIASAGGAQIANGTCRVDIEEMKKVEPLTYEQMIGTWTFVCEDGNFNVTLEEDEAAPGQNLHGVLDYMGIPAEFTLIYKETGADFQLGDLAFQADFGDLGSCLCVWSSLAGSSLSISGTISSNWYDDGELEFNGTLAGGLFSPADGSFMGYVGFQWTNPHMVKMQ